MFRFKGKQKGLQLTDEEILKLKNIEKTAYMEKASQLAIIRGQQKAQEDYKDTVTNSKEKNKGDIF